MHVTFFGRSPHPCNAKVTYGNPLAAIGVSLFIFDIIVGELILLYVTGKPYHC